jgi:heat-inducible transcriptional repressor
MINKRAEQILQAVVERYIREGQPVASRALADESGVELSSASIRHIMADLEAEGYLISPHTSAGRIPTSQGYRLFVDNLLMVQQPAIQKMQELQAQLNPHSDAQVLVQQASQLLSDVTQLVSVVTLPRIDQFILRQVEFLPLSENRILVVLVINDYEVQNRVMRINRKFTRSELTQAGNFLTEHYAGLDLADIRDCFIKDIKQQQLQLEDMLQAVMEFADDICTQDRSDCVVSGQRHLLGGVEHNNYDRLRELFEVFAQKREILDLLDQTIDAQGIQIFIGEESGYKPFEGYSLVTAAYTHNDQVMGMLGVIGPTRMAYDKVISAVDVTANILSQSFNMDVCDEVR